MVELVKILQSQDSNFKPIFDPYVKKEELTVKAYFLYISISDVILIAVHLNNQTKKMVNKKFLNL